MKTTKELVKELLTETEKLGWVRSMKNELDKQRDRDVGQIIRCRDNHDKYLVMAQNKIVDICNIINRYIDIDCPKTVYNDLGADGIGINYEGHTDGCIRGAIFVPLCDVVEAIKNNIVLTKDWFDKSSYL